MAKKRTNFVPHGSDEHAALLGLTKDKNADLGWKLSDVTLFGPNASERYLKAILEQKVRELKGKPVKGQSRDPAAPNYHPPMWRPEVDS